MEYFYKDSKDTTPEERLDALAEVLAEGFLYLIENEMLQKRNESVNTIPLPVPSLKKFIEGTVTEGNPCGTPSLRYVREGAEAKIFHQSPLISGAKEGSPSLTGFKGEQ